MELNEEHIEAVAAANNIRCSLCPSEENADLYPVHPDLANAPLADLRCGHQVHTHCLLHIFYGNNVHRNYAHTCMECHVSFISEDDTNFFANNNPDHRIPGGANVRTLWGENGEFRDSVLEIRKDILRLSPLNKKFQSKAKEIKNTFRDNTRLSVEIIRDHIRTAKRQYNAIPEKRKVDYLQNAIRTKFYSLSRKYNVERWDLQDLRNVPGAPKFPRNFRNYYHRRYRYGIFKVLVR